MRHISVLIFLLSISFCQAQAIRVIYRGVSSDSSDRGHQLEFKNDATLELSSISAHIMVEGFSFRMTFNYKKTNGNTLEVYKTRISTEDSITLVSHGLNQYLNSTILTIEGKALTDQKNKRVYVVCKDYKKNSPIIIVNGKVYTRKRSKGLKREMASIEEEADNYEVKIYRGWDAYKKVGYEGVCGGVLEWKRKM